MRSKVLSVLLFLAISGILTGQQVSHVKNFDAVFFPGAERIFVAPPVGKVWIIRSGLFALEKPIQGLELTIFKQDSPGPVPTCTICETLIRVNLGVYSQVPIVGSYAMNAQGGILRGLENPITIQYPQSIGINIHGLSVEQGNVNGWIRISIEERDIKSSPKIYVRDRP